MKSLRVVLNRILHLIILCCPLSICYAQDRIKTFPSQEPIKLDGLLDEPCWKQAPVTSEFRQRDPQEGEPASEKTVIRVVLSHFPQVSTRISPPHLRSVQFKNR